MSTFTIIETPASEFPKTLNQEIAYVKDKLSGKAYLPFDTVSELLVKAKYYDVKYDGYLHEACKIIYNNHADEHVIKTVGKAVDKRYGITGLQSIYYTVSMISLYLTHYRLVSAHLRDYIDGCFDGIGEWRT